MGRCDGGQHGTFRVAYGTPVGCGFSINVRGVVAGGVPSTCWHLNQLRLPGSVRGDNNGAFPVTLSARMRSAWTPLGSRIDLAHSLTFSATWGFKRLLPGIVPWAMITTLLLWRWRPACMPPLCVLTRKGLPRRALFVQSECLAATLSGE